MSGWIVGAGTAGLMAFAGGALLSGLPPVDAADDEVVAVLSRRRAAILGGSVLSVTGATLLLAPLAAAAVADPWSARGLFGLAVWVLGFAFLAIGALVPAALSWRDPAALPSSVVRLGLDLAHLATWSVSAPIGAVATAVTTASVVRGDIAGGPTAGLLVALAAAKVATVGVELAGTGRRTGGNAGGWAWGVSGYVTVAWLAALVLALA